MSTHFTVVIPTRQRCDTLLACLQTCVEQNYDNCEFIVNDNASTDQTQEVVSSFRDPRIRYFNTGERLGLASNWESALTRVTKDGYVTYIGDDDGLMPDALKMASGIMAEIKPRALTCEEVGYHWPSYSREKLRNHIIIPLTAGLARFDSEKAIEAVRSFRKPYSHLPMLYRSFIQSSVIKEIVKVQKGASFFKSMAPDLYSGIAIGLYLKEYWHCRRPLIVNGTSGHSIGTSSLSPGADHKIAIAVDNEEKTIQFHENLRTVESIPLLVAESILQARDHLPFAAGMSFDFRRLSEAALRAVQYFPPNDYQRVADAFLQMASDRDVEAEIKEIINGIPNRPATNRPLILGVNIKTKSILLDGSELGLKTVSDASRFAGQFLQLRESGYVTLRGIAASTVKFLKREIRSRMGSKGLQSDLLTNNVAK